MKPLEADDPRAIGRYRVVGRLGAGGMGRVFVGTSPDGRTVALKQVHASLAEDSDFKGRFRREVAASRSVSGAYTAAVMDADTEASVPWLASVFVPGPALDSAVGRGGPLPVNTVRILGAGLAAALGEIHRAGLIHRDLKPSNVLLADDGPRVIDFGIARAAEGVQLTQTGFVVGSPGYMSPEQVEGRDLTSASDMFSLGAVLVYAATGAGPFGEGPTAGLMYKVVNSGPELSAVPPPLREVIGACLAKAPEQRPTPDQLLDRIGGVDPGESWLPSQVQGLIQEQRDKVKRLLAGSDPESAPAAATSLQPQSGPRPAPTPPRPASTPPPGPTSNPRPNAPPPGPGPVPGPQPPWAQRPSPPPGPPRTGFYQGPTPQRSGGGGGGSNTGMILALGLAGFAAVFVIIVIIIAIVG